VEPRTIVKRQRPEAEIQRAITLMLENRGWMVKVTHGSAYQSGFPDLYATHHRFGPRWVEVKNIEAYSITPAQAEDFPKLTDNGTKIWILCKATDDEYLKLFDPPNWQDYIRIRDVKKYDNLRRYRKPEILLPSIHGDAKIKTLLPEVKRDYESRCRDSLRE